MGKSKYDAIRIAKQQLTESKQQKQKNEITRILHDAREAME